MEKELYSTEFIIESTFIPHEGSDYHHEDICYTISEDILSFNVKYDAPIMMIGDFNATCTTGNLADFLTIEDHIAELSGIEPTDNELFNNKHMLELLGITTDKYNQDIHTNNNGYSL